MRTLVFPVVVFAGVLLVAGCTGTTVGSPQPAASGGTTSSTNGSGNGDTTEDGAPRVKTPIDYAKAAASPCGVLTPAQLPALVLAGVASKDTSDSLGPACSWAGYVGPSGLSVSFIFVAGEGGLNYLYRMKESYRLFVPQPPLQGQPALLNAPTDDRKDGKCVLDVGLTDTKILTTSVQIRNDSKPRFNDPCGLAREAADLALTSIKGGS